MKTSRVTRRVVRRWLSRVRRFEPIDLVCLLGLSMSEGERDVLRAMIVRELHRRGRARMRLRGTW